MDQLTPVGAFEYDDPPIPTKRRALKRVGAVVFGVVVLVLAVGGGYRLGQGGWSLPAWLPRTVVAALGGRTMSSAALPTGPIIYYRHPDGKPLYTTEPTKTADARDYLPVRASEDVTFEDKPPEAVAAGGPNAGSGKRILYYRNPMGLPDISQVPKKDSMGMDYLPVVEGEVDDGATVTLSPGKLQRTGVRSEPAARRVVSRPVRVPGTIELDERRVSVVSMRSDSFIEKVENVTTGDRVRKGQPLLELYSPEVNSAAAQLVANLGYEGSRRRLENLGLSSEVIAEMGRTRKVPATITWLAPQSGIITERNAIAGMKALSGQVLFRLADVSTVWVLADVPEQEFGALKPGQAVAVRVRSMPGRSFAGRIALIYPQVSMETRTGRVRIELPNPEEVLLPGMYADVEVATGSGIPVVAVPESAVLDSGTRQVVILDKGEGRFEPREVKVGARGEGVVEIREGVAEGDRVVTTANFLIDAESNLKAALRGLVGPEKPQ